MTVSGIVFAMKIPTVFGSMHSCTWQASDLALPDTCMPKGPFNLACLVTNLTTNLAKCITTEELEKLTLAFHTGLKVYDFLNTNKKKDPLINEALNDIKASSNYFISQNNALGQSRWASLQAVEKMLKYSLKMANIEYPKTHILNKLAGKYPRIDLNVRDLLNDVQIEPGVRYGEPSTNRSEAYSAHTSTIQILGYLVNNLKSIVSDV